MIAVKIGGEIHVIDPLQGYYPTSGGRVEIALNHKKNEEYFEGFEGLDVNYDMPPSTLSEEDHDFFKEAIGYRLGEKAGANPFMRQGSKCSVRQ